MYVNIATKYTLYIIEYTLIWYAQLNNAHVTLAIIQKFIVLHYFGLHFGLILLKIYPMYLTHGCGRADFFKKFILNFEYFRFDVLRVS